MNDYGRPSSYSKAYCEEAVQYLAQGHSIAAFAGYIGVARSTVYQWQEQFPEFADAVKTGQAKAIDWWEQRLLKIAEGADGNVTAAIFGLKNRAADEWREKQTHEHTGKDGGDLVIRWEK